VARPLSQALRIISSTGFNTRGEKPMGAFL
jgi:hypothetical protein